MADYRVHWTPVATRKLLQILQTSRYGGNNLDWVQRKFIACLAESRRLLARCTFKQRYRLHGLPCCRLPLKSYPVIIYFVYAGSDSVSVFYVRHASRKERATRLD